MSNEKENQKTCDEGKEDATADAESIDEEVEPKLKYVRISVLKTTPEQQSADHNEKFKSLQDILHKDAASCIAVHPKFVCLGTHWGEMYLLDHQGNVNRQLRPHTVSVNQISIDGQGETVASCSDDGKVHVVSLFGAADDHTLNVGRLVKAVALDPAGGGRRLVVGDDKLTLYERTFLGRWRTTVLSESEGAVASIAWGGDFVAWSSAAGVRVYDTGARCSLGLIKWSGSEGRRCNLRWCGRTLIVAWADTVRVCVIRRRSGGGGTSTAAQSATDGPLTEHIVDPVSTFRTDMQLSGAAPLGEGQLVLLGVPLERGADGKSLRPQLRVVEYRDSDYTELCTDSLSLRGYREWSGDDYHLETVPDEERFFIVAPKDVVVASPYDPDDRIAWLVQHARFEEALAAVRETASGSRRHTEASVGGAYLDRLLAERRWQDAARLCVRVFGTERAPWQEHIYKFARAHRLRDVAPYLPRGPPPLDPQVYEMVLYEHLRLDRPGFLALVREWREPGLYNTAAVINAVLEQLTLKDGDSDVLMEAAAVLYTHNGRYDSAVALYLKLRHPDVFALAQRPELRPALADMTAELMLQDASRACELLLTPEALRDAPPDAVVARLVADERLLYQYLRALDKRDSRLSTPYHGAMVRLYSIYDRELLLPFLRRSEQYPIQEALEVCRRKRYYPELVYLLGRIGETREALVLINRELGDIRQALEFCQEHDDADLWSDLIEHGLTRPEFVTYLLPRIGPFVDPCVLVWRLEGDGDGERMPGLRRALVSTLRQSRLRVDIQHGCQKLLVADYFGLHERLVATQKRGLAVGEELVCPGCGHRVLHQALPLVVYNCRHTFHERCLQGAERNLCNVCHPHRPD